jgi:hypothetical protein
MLTLLWDLCSVNVAFTNVGEVHAAPNLGWILKMVAACTSETLQLCSDLYSAKTQELGLHFLANLLTDQPTYITK